ncbi:hypothetical protein QIS99_17305 [Streptomyces sp. B-S-A8]|uniref:Uncharacterized protein n=1 Tax=Streptomyces solicavernae TaxID=3043614 RepID=A0ABT6RU30_9ACTN|nr:hypothetical protein [Streptomyces sp. B-S-A8]MDI3387942.1 hypothetical protein [Streptomyces sp. B-S-A8]
MCRAATGPATADEPPQKISGSGSGGSAVNPTSTWSAPRAGTRPTPPPAVHPVVRADLRQRPAPPEQRHELPWPYAEFELADDPERRPPAAGRCVSAP